MTPTDDLWIGLAMAAVIIALLGGIALVMWAA